jgi:hypothetical protein
LFGHFARRRRFYPTLRPISPGIANRVWCEDTIARFRTTPRGRQSSDIARSSG